MQQSLSQVFTQEEPLQVCAQGDAHGHWSFLSKQICLGNSSEDLITATPWTDEGQLGCQEFNLNQGKGRGTEFEGKILERKRDKHKVRFGSHFNSAHEAG